MLSVTDEILLMAARPTWVESAGLTGLEASIEIVRQQL